MTDDTPPVLYISADTSDLTTRYKATPRMHMAAKAWYPEETVEALRKERDALKVSYDDLYAGALADAKSDAQEFESDLWKSIRSILNDLDYDWSGDAMEDGVTADEAAQFIRDALEGETHRAEKAEADRDRLAAAIVGDTGLSAMTVATQARLFRPRAEAAEAHVAALTARVEGLTGAVTFALSEYDAPNDIDEAMSKLRTELSKDAALSHNGRGE